MARYGIVVDLNRCTGCMTCVIACKAENLTPPKVSWEKILEVESETKNRILYFPLACMHCDDAPCIPACPERAIYKIQDGIVLIDRERCQGHGECVKACPYGAIDINPDETYFQGETLPYESTPAPYQVHLPGKASKCTLCSHRIEQGREPACVEACPSKAMVFGDLNDPKSPIQSKLPESVQLLADQKTQSKFFYKIPGDLLREIEQKIISLFSRPQHTPHPH
jgi:Fe-S-cluster-containing dehydrogenase component